jgi:hypothetical protein
MTDDQFMVQVLNSLISDYELQMLLLEKQIGSKDNHLRFERRSTTQNDNLGKENALFTLQFKVKCRNWGKLGHKTAQCKSMQGKDEKVDVMCNYCKKACESKLFQVDKEELGRETFGLVKVEPRATIAAMTLPCVILQ